MQCLLCSVQDASSARQGFCTKHAQRLTASGQRPSHRPMRSNPSNEQLTGPQAVALLTELRVTLEEPVRSALQAVQEPMFVVHHWSPEDIRQYDRYHDQEHTPTLEVRLSRRTQHTMRTFVDIVTLLTAWAQEQNYVHHRLSNAFTVQFPSWESQ